MGCGGQSSAPVNPAGVAPQERARTRRGAANQNRNVNELPEPPTVRSANGVAKVSLIVDFSGATASRSSFSKCRRRRADDPRESRRHDRDGCNERPASASWRQFDMNIHFHGMGSSPLAPGDDVLGTLARPGQRLHYVVHIPKNQEPGLYWYHPHVHGETSYQVGSGGMSGAIVVNGLERHLPGLAKMKSDSSSCARPASARSVRDA